MVRTPDPTVGDASEATVGDLPDAIVGDAPDAIVGDAPAPYSVPVVLVESDPRWPQWFDADAASIRAALGDTVIAVDHVGSTSVPQLPAKPVIDILLQVPDAADETTYVPALEALGYWLQIREPEWLEHRVLYQRVAHGNPHDINLHVLDPVRGTEEIQRLLAMRDWLRNHPEDRELYAATKRKLATRQWRYVQDYADAKSDVIEQIIARASRPAQSGLEGQRAR